MTKKIIGVGEFGVSRNPGDILSTYALGSCVAVAMFDVVNKVSGLVHVALPDSKINEDKARELPGFYADTGIPVLLDHMRSLGATPVNHQITAKLFGGIKTAMSFTSGDIGKRNALAIRKILWAAGFLITLEDVGGDQIRSIFVNASDCSTVVKVHGLEDKTYF